MTTTPETPDRDGSPDTGAVAVVGPTRILLADDSGIITASAREAALDLARNWNATLDIITVTPPAEPEVLASTELKDDLAVACAAAGVALTRHTRSGDAAKTVVECAGDLGADLLILGSHGTRARALGGSVGAAVLNAAQTPVLIVREATWPPSRIIVGDDGSIEARAAMELAAEIGSAFSACALLVEAVPELREPGHNPAMVALAAHVSDEEAQRLSDDTALMSERLHGPAVALVSHETPVLALRRTVDDATQLGHVLVAVGSSGKTEFDRHLGWSVSARIAGIETASVLVVPRAWALRVRT